MSFAPFTYSFPSPAVTPAQLSVIAPAFRSSSSASSTSSSSSSSTTSVVHCPPTASSVLIRPSPPSPPPPPASLSFVMFSPNLLHAYPRIAALRDSMCHSVPGSTPGGPVYSTGCGGQGYGPFGPTVSSSAFYAPLNGDSVDTWHSISGHVKAPNGWASFDQTPLVGYPYGSYSGLDVRRKNATRESTSTLKAWLYEHIKNPYPTKGEKIMLAIITKMTLTQVSTWFANARRRLKKENKMQWSPRNRTGDDDDDDDDDKNSDNDDDDETGSKSGLTQNNADSNDEEDIVVDSGNDESFPLPPNGFHEERIPQQPGVKLRSDDLETEKRIPSSPSPVEVFLCNSSRTEQDHVEGRSSASRISSTDSSPVFASVSVSTSTVAVATVAVTTVAVATVAVATVATPRPSDKPRIWSLADVATSATPPGGARPSRQSPLAPPSARPLPPVNRRVTSPASTSGHRSFQPWICASFSNSSPRTGYVRTPFLNDVISVRMPLDTCAAPRNATGAGAGDSADGRLVAMGNRLSENSREEETPDPKRPNPPSPKLFSNNNSPPAEKDP